MGYRVRRPLRGQQLGPVREFSEPVGGEDGPERETRDAGALLVSPFSNGGFLMAGDFHFREVFMNESARLGRLIAVSGIDGAGKTTQMRALTSWLQGQGLNAQCLVNQTMLPVRRSLDVIAREEGFASHLDMLGADTIRLISACAKLSALAPVQENIQVPGMVTLVDRYTYCQYAAVRLQKADNESFLRRLNRSLPTPDLILFLDVTPEIAQHRIRQRGIDDETLEFLTEYRAAYQSLPEYESFTVIDGNGDPESVQQRLRTEVQRVLPPLVPAAPKAR